MYLCVCIGTQSVFSVFVYFLFAGLSVCVYLFVFIFSYPYTIFSIYEFWWGVAVMRRLVSMLVITHIYTVNANKDSGMSVCVYIFHSQLFRHSRSMQKHIPMLGSVVKISPASEGNVWEHTYWQSLQASEWTRSEGEEIIHSQPRVMEGSHCMSCRATRTDTLMLLLRQAAPIPLQRHADKCMSLRLGTYFVH